MVILSEVRLRELLYKVEEGVNRTCPGRVPLHIVSDPFDDACRCLRAQ